MKTMQSMMVIFSVLALLGAAAPARADGDKGDFAKKHPRRAQVIKREKNQKAKNNAAAKNGQITQQQAKQLDHEDNRIRSQERADAAANGGHITKSEQRQLNREENGVNRQRTQDERKDASQAGSSVPVSSN